MNRTTLPPLRILAVDDEQNMLDIYAELLGPEGDRSPKLRELQERLFGPNPSRIDRPAYDPVLCHGAEEAVEAVRASVEEGNPFAVAFVDIRMPPGPDGVWAAERMRGLDRDLEIVMVTAFTDVHPAEIALRVPPPEKLLYVQKPFHAEEIRHFAASLGAKWRAQRFLQGAQRELERMVAERTAELAQANAALETVVRNRDEERTRFERQIILNLQRLVRPHLERLAGTGLDRRQQAHLEAVEANLAKITSPLTGRTSSAYSALTPKEIEVAKMIRAGRTSDQIAEKMSVTPAAVKFHRNRIREKFGLKNRGANLRSFLLSLDPE